MNEKEELRLIGMILGVIGLLLLAIGIQSFSYVQYVPNNCCAGNENITYPKSVPLPVIHDRLAPLLIVDGIALVVFG